MANAMKIFFCFFFALLLAETSLAQNSSQNTPTHGNFYERLWDEIGKVGGTTAPKDYKSSLAYLTDNYAKLKNPCGLGVKVLGRLLQDSRSGDITGTSTALELINNLRQIAPGGKIKNNAGTEITLAALEKNAEYAFGVISGRVKSPSNTRKLIAVIGYLKQSCNYAPWTTSYGDILFPKDLTKKHVVRTYYTDDGGRLEGVYDPVKSQFKGYWSENGSAEDCKRTSGKSFLSGTFWGQVEFNFQPGLKTFTGKYGYCDRALSDPWTGNKK